MNRLGELAALRRFVTGDAGREALEELGARLRFESGTLRLEEPADAPVYEPSASEIAAGLIAHWAVGTSLQEWARLLLATTMIDLTSLEDHPAGELLLESIWDAAEGSDIGERRLDVARDVASTD